MEFAHQCGTVSVYTMFGRINPLITPMATGYILVWAGGIRIFFFFQIIGPHGGRAGVSNPGISFTLSMVSVLFVETFRASVGLSAGVGYKFWVFLYLCHRRIKIELHVCLYKTVGYCLPSMLAWSFCTLQHRNILLCGKYDGRTSTSAFSLKSISSQPVWARKIRPVTLCCWLRLRIKWFSFLSPVTHYWILLSMYIMKKPKNMP